MNLHDPASIMQAEHALAQAHVTLDIATIDTLLHPEYLIVQPGGTLETKDDVLASYQSGQRQWRTAAVDDLDVNIYGDMARVVGVWKAEGTNHGHALPIKRGLFRSGFWSVTAGASLPTRRRK